MTIGTRNGLASAMSCARSVIDALLPSRGFGSGGFLYQHGRPRLSPAANAAPEVTVPQRSQYIAFLSGLLLAIALARMELALQLWDYGHLGTLWVTLYFALPFFIMAFVWGYVSLRPMQAWSSLSRPWVYWRQRYCWANRADEPRKPSRNGI
jgi:hypothetical protein